MKNLVVTRDLTALLPLEAGEHAVSSCLNPSEPYLYVATNFCDVVCFNTDDMQVIDLLVAACTVLPHYCLPVLPGTGHESTVIMSVINTRRLPGGSRSVPWLVQTAGLQGSGSPWSWMP
jgi:hypothetical protein